MNTSCPLPSSNGYFPVIQLIFLSLLIQQLTRIWYNHLNLFSNFSLSFYLSTIPPFLLLFIYSHTPFGSYFSSYNADMYMVCLLNFLKSVILQSQWFHLLRLISYTHLLSNHLWEPMHSQILVLCIQFHASKCSLACCIIVRWKALLHCMVGSTVSNYKCSRQHTYTTDACNKYTTDACNK